MKSRSATLSVTACPVLEVMGEYGTGVTDPLLNIAHLRKIQRDQAAFAVPGYTSWQAWNP